MLFSVIKLYFLNIVFVFGVNINFFSCLVVLMFLLFLIIVIGYIIGVWDFFGVLVIIFVWFEFLVFVW